jgi:hypothetical protein
MIAYLVFNELYSIEILPNIYQNVKYEPVDGFEPPTYCLQNSCSTTELYRHITFFY